MWEAFKTWFAKLMVAVGIDWPAIGDGDKLDFIATVGLGAVGFFLSVLGVVLAVLAIRLGKKANELTAKATAVAEKQDAYLEQERAKRARFQVISPEAKGVGRQGLGLYEFGVWVTNTGRRPSRGYLYVGVPKRVMSKVQLSTNEGVRSVPLLYNYDIRVNEFDDPEYSHFFDDYELLKFQIADEIGPLEGKWCLTVKIESKRGEDDNHFQRTFLWFTQTPDGRYPETSAEKILMAYPNEHFLKYPHPSNDGTARQIL